MKAEDKISSEVSIKIESKDLKKVAELIKSANYCYDCNRCVNVCPVSELGLFYPRQLLSDFSTLSIDETIEYSNIWSCLTCGQCVEYCPMSKDKVGVNFLDIILQLRNIASEHEHLQEEISKCTTHGRMYANLPRLMANNEVEFVNRTGFLDNTDLKTTEKGEIAYFIGCIPFMDKISPCRRACPAGTDVQGYVTLIREGKFQEALDLIRKRIPLPAVCGRICPAPCEDACNRSNIDNPIAIRALKRFVADWEIKNAPLSQIKPSKQIKEKVAIIGSGPSGLSAAYYLAKKGYKVTVFESSPFKGGMLRLGIPKYRLPDDILDYEIEFIEKNGVEIKTSTPIGPDLTFDDLKKQGYKAIYISIGLQSNRKMNIPGENLKNVISGIEFLKNYKILDLKSEKFDLQVKNKIVGVVGGGNVAMDAARTSIRLGAKKVVLIYRRSREEMPASDEEIEMATEENIEFQFLTNPINLIGDENDNLTEIECVRMKLGEPDASGRRRPIPIEGSEFKIKINILMLAIGQVADSSLLKAAHHAFKLSKQGKIQIDNVTLETDIPGVFAGGDITGGEGIVVRAIGNGYEAAKSIDRYLRGLDLREGRIKKERLFPAATPKKEVITSPRRSMQLIPAEDRISSFSECEIGLTEEEAIHEAERCMLCNICSNCDFPPSSVDGQKFECFYGTQLAVPTSDRINYMSVPGTIIGLLNQNDIIPVVLGDEKCCGHDNYWVGDFDTFEKLARHNIKLFQDAGVKTIICNCAEGYYMWKFVYQEFFRNEDNFNFDFEVYHISEYILKEKLLNNIFIPHSEKIKVTYHDPCRLGRMSNIFDAPREILKKIPFVELVEMKHNRKDSICCGVSANISCSIYSKQIQGKRIQEAVDAGAEYMIVACPKCLTHFNCYLHENPNINLKVICLISFLGMLYHY
jgi:NADPH-dependent glutamate synthase beta subunit-like oxidoreductase/Fe-S oxidoreductase